MMATQIVAMAVVGVDVTMSDCIIVIPATQTSIVSLPQVVQLCEIVVVYVIQTDLVLEDVLHDQIHRMRCARMIASVQMVPAIQYQIRPV